MHRSRILKRKEVNRMNELMFEIEPLEERIAPSYIGNGGSPLVSVNISNNNTAVAVASANCGCDGHNGNNEASSS